MKSSSTTTNLLLPFLPPILSTDTPSLENLLASFLPAPRAEGPEPAGEARLQIEAAPFLARPGDALALTVRVENVGTLPLSMLVLSGTVSEGVEGLHAPEGWNYDQSSGRLGSVLPTLEVGAVYSATFSARATGRAAQAGHVIFHLEAGGAGLPRVARAGALVVVERAGEGPAEAAFLGEAGGILSSSDGRVQAAFPPGALRAPGLLRAGHLPWGLLRARGMPLREWAGYYRALRPFALEVRDEAGNTLSSFARPVTLTVSYDPEEVEALSMEEADLALFWWNEAYTRTSEDGSVVQGLWVPLPSQVDVERHTVTAAVEHFSVFALSDGSSPSEAFLPSLQGFQVSPYTGAASFSYPIAVPKGPGGLAPGLALSYSSAAVDGKGGIRNKQQAGWVGRGWSLGLDYIAVVKNPATGSRNRNSYAIVLDGFSSDLVKHSDGENGLPNPHYHVADEQFWAVWQEGVGAGTHYDNYGAGWVALADTVWYVRTKDGTLYQFGSTTPGDFGNRAWWAYDRSDNAHPAGCGNYIETYRWYLTKVTDVHGNTVEYSYAWAGSPSTFQYCACGKCVKGALQADVWPTEVRWGSAGNLRFRVVFESSARTNDTQYEAAEAQLGQAPHETRVLDKIRVESMPGANWELVRRYDLTYDYTLRPDGGGDYPKLTLKSIQMKGKDGVSPLPATTFTYEMGGANYPYDTNGKYRLKTASNGYGGVVTYTYEKIPTDSFLTQHRNRVTARKLADGLGHEYTWTYSYENARENYQTNAASVWYALHVVGDTSYLVHAEYAEFRGHRKVVEVDPNLNKVEHYFYQGDGYDEGQSACTISTWGDACAQRQEAQEALLGREWKTVWHSSDLNVTYRKVVKTFTVEPLPYDEATYKKYGLRRNFAYQSREVGYTYDGDATERHKTTVYVYDPAYQGGEQWGNLTHVKEYGERNPATQNPIRITTKRYAVNPAAWIAGAVVEEGVYAETTEAANWQALTYYIYDNQAPFAAPTAGDLTRVMRVRTLDLGTWLAVTVDTSYGYDAYGNRTSETVYGSEGSLQVYAGGSYGPATGDPRTMGTAYDPVYHVYPVSVSYPNGRSETAAYDYRLGLVTSYTDVNEDTTQYRYDAFGRFWKMWKPGDTESLPTVENAYADGTMEPAVPMMWAVWRKGEADAAPWTVGGTWERRFYDGLGRLVAVQRPDYDWDGAGGGHEVVVWTQYDGVGQKVAESVPYERAAYAYNPNCEGTGKVCNPYKYPALPDGGQPKTQYAYDPLGRVVQVTNPDGSTVQTIYNDRVTAEVDEKGHKVEREQDALGRMVVVREYTGASPNFTLYATTNYAYDVKDQLLSITDAAGNQTSLVYDKLGRKVQMSDPDMGTWEYVYDALGNMTRQRDARGQRICFYYDSMNRVKGKMYRSDDVCPTPGPGYPLNVTYLYDNDLGDANAYNSWGRLRRAYVGSSYTTNGHDYKYDARGRTIWEKVWVDGAGYETAYTYDAMDRVKTMTYPGGEVVTHGYLPSGALNSVVGDTTYVGQTTYTAWGAVDLMKLGAAGSPILQVDYTYYAWNGGSGEGQGRLYRITAGTPGNPTSLQDLRYTDYDLVGNIVTIQDWKAGSPQTQSFTYDDLDRLLSGSASGGTYGNYSESYAYSGNDGKIGNLTSKGGMGYTYGAAQPHAVRRVSGSGGSGKTITIYAKKSGTGTPTMQLYINGQYQAQWNVTSTGYSAYTASNKTLSGNDVVEVVYTNDDGSRDLYVDKVVVDGVVVQAEGGAAVLDLGSGSGAFDGRDVVVGAELFPGNGALRLVKGAQAMALGYDVNGNMTSRVREGEGQILAYDVENRLVKVEKSGATLAEFVYGPAGERIKGVVSGVTTVYVGNHYEVQGGTIRKYYYAGPQRVAMREGGTLYWLLADHLGSTAITANADGSFKAEVRYKAWGEERPACGSPPCGTTPTTYRYTGQRAEAGIGLYYYNARWYDPALARFVQADTVVPDPGNPQQLNRLSYVLNNPVSRIDPTGHEDITITTEELINEIIRRWGITVVGHWRVVELLWVFEGIELLANSLGGGDSGDAALRKLLGIESGHPLFLDRDYSPEEKGRGKTTRWNDTSVWGVIAGVFGGPLYGGAEIDLFNKAFQSREEAMNTIIHELGHVMVHYNPEVQRQFETAVAAAGGGDTLTEYAMTPGEDWPESLAVTLVPVERAWGWKIHYHHWNTTAREQYIRHWLRSVGILSMYQR